MSRRVGVPDDGTSQRVWWGSFGLPLNGQRLRGEGEVCVFADREDPSPPPETLLLGCRSQACVELAERAERLPIAAMLSCPRRA